MGGFWLIAGIIKYTKVSRLTLSELEQKIDEEYVKDEINFRHQELLIRSETDDIRLKLNELKNVRKETGFYYIVHYTVDEENRYHSYNDNPAFVKYETIGKSYEKKWYKNGVLHRDNDEPALINVHLRCYYTDGVLKKTAEYYRDILSSITFYKEDGSREKEYRYKDSKLYKMTQFYDDKTKIVIKYYENGNIQEKKWYKNGKLFRENGPICQTFDKYGNLKKETFKENLSV